MALCVLVCLLLTGTLGESSQPNLTISMEVPMRLPVPVSPVVAAITVIVLLGFPISPAHAGDVTGTILFSGTPPPVKTIAVTKDIEVCGKEETPDERLLVHSQGGIQNVVVMVEGVEGAAAKEPAGDAQMVQKGCTFSPHVVIVRPGAPIPVLNQDGILHNFHTFSELNPPVNLAQPGFRKKMMVEFKKTEMVKASCDVHPWMHAVFVVTDTPFVTITDEQGNFALNDLPPGTHTIRIWHETLGNITREVTVPATGSVTLNAKLSMP